MPNSSALGIKNLNCMRFSDQTDLFPSVDLTMPFVKFPPSQQSMSEIANKATSKMSPTSFELGQTVAPQDKAILGCSYLKVHNNGGLNM